MPYKDIDKQREYSKNHYRENKRKYLDSNSRRRTLLKEYVNGIKANTPCTDCHVQYPYYVMDFDHLRDKTALIKKFVRDNNKSGLEIEIKKCELVCANCHRIRTNQRLINQKPSISTV